MRVVSRPTRERRMGGGERRRGVDTATTARSCPCTSDPSRRLEMTKARPRLEMRPIHSLLLYRPLRTGVQSPHYGVFAFSLPGAFFLPLRRFR